MTAAEQRRLALDLDSHVRNLRSFNLDGAPLLQAMSGRLADLKALVDAAGPGGVGRLAAQFPDFGRVATLLAGLPKGRSRSAVRSCGPAGIQDREREGQEGTRRVAPLPVRLQHAAALLEQADDPLAADARHACREVASRLVLFEETLGRMLRGEKGAAEWAREMLALDWS